MSIRTSRASKRWMVAATAAVVCGSTLAISGAATAGPGTAAPVSERISGANRYETAVAVAKELFTDTGDYCNITIASGEDFPDGLAAAIFYQPILLTQVNALPAVTQAEMNRLIGTPSAPGSCSTGSGATFQPDLDTTVVGGPSVISSAQKEMLDTYGTSTRVAGADRYATAIAVAGAVDASFGDVSEVLLATGVNFPDALAGGVYAQDQYAPILLNDGDTVRPDVAAYLLAENVQKVTILGGPSAVPASVEAELKGALGITTVTRISGPNRSATAVAIANAFNPGPPQGFPGGDGVTVVNGFGFADALSSAPLAYLASGTPRPILLTAVDAIPTETAAYHKNWCDSIEFIDAIGGTSVISSAVVTGAVAAATCSSPDVTKATLLNNDFKQAVFTLNAGLTVTAKAGSPADGAVANAWQVALVQNGLPGTESVVVDPEGNDNAAYGGIPTFIMTANFPALTNQGFVNVWNGSPAASLTTAATTDGTGLTGLPSSASPGTVAPLIGFATTLGSQDSTVVVTFDRLVSVATPSGLYPNLNPATGPLTLGAFSFTPDPLVVAVTRPNGVATVTYKWNDSTSGIPMLPSSQIRFAAGSVVDGVSGTASSTVVAETLVAP